MKVFLFLVPLMIFSCFTWLMACNRVGTGAAEETNPNDTENDGTGNSSNDDSLGWGIGKFEER